MQKLARPVVLICLLVVTILLSVSFVLISREFGFRFIDQLWAPGIVLADVGAMTPKQRFIHILSTATLDVAYPLAYGSLLLGLAIRYFRGSGYLEFLILPAILVVPTDIVEGLVQILILNGHYTFLQWKFWLTLLKFGLFYLALAIALGGFVYRLFVHWQGVFRRRRKSPEQG